MMLEVSAVNDAAIAFYLRHGFAEIARRPRYYRDGSDALVLSRPDASPAVGRMDAMSDEPLVLGIETSCDETGVGIVRGHTLLADAVASSVEEHARFGGVVPEVASRAHLEAMVPTIERACETAGIRLNDVDAIAVTSGPGLAGALLVGRREREGARRSGWASRCTASTTSRHTWPSTSSSTGRCPSPAWRCWSRAATPACSRSRT